MIEQSVLLLLMLLIILLASHLFTNALEHLAEKWEISSGLAGSVLAAVGTALPETFVPLVALYAGSSNPIHNQNISQGAILGAPMMLSTLSIVMMALSAVSARGINGRIVPEKTGFIRDMNFFLMSYVLSIIAMFIPPQYHYQRNLISVVLVVMYLIYLSQCIKVSTTLVNQGHSVETEEPLVLSRLGLIEGQISIYMQLTLALFLLYVGAKGFVHGIESISNSMHISAFLISLLIIPIATELPEKINSILWVRRNKDTLGFGNITGAMVFQATLLMAIGITLTPWLPDQQILLSMFVTLLAACWLRFNVASTGLRIKMLMINGVLYLGYLYLVLLKS